MRQVTRYAEGCGPRSVLVSSCYKVLLHGAISPPSVLLEHCCLMTEGNTWDINVRCRPLHTHNNDESNWKNSWRNVKEVDLDAKVEGKHNDIEVTLPFLSKDLEVAAFGTPGKDDQKRMQMAIFGRRPTKGKDWKIRIYLINDSTVAFKLVCQKEEKLGNKLLTALAGLFVSNSDEDIRIEFTALEPGWQIKGNKVKTIKSRDAWNSPENSEDFPRCDFEIIHVDQTKQHFFCAVKVSHEQDSANTEVVALFEQKGGRQGKQSFEGSKKLKIGWANLLSDKTERLSVLNSLLGWLIDSGHRKQMVKGSAVV